MENMAQKYNVWGFDFQWLCDMQHLTPKSNMSDCNQMASYAKTSISIWQITNVCQYPFGNLEQTSISVLTTHELM
jgi:hypothetical protein